MPVARIDRHESPLGRWTRATAAVDGRLTGLLHQPYVGFVQERAAFAHWIEPPPPALTLIIGLEGGLRTAAGGALPDAWLGGLSDAAELVEMPGRQALVDLKLTPLGAYAVLGRPLDELTGRVVALDELFGADGRRLAERVRDARGWAARFAAIDGFLAARAAAGPRPTPAVQRAWTRLHATGGRTPVAELAAELRCSRRYLTAAFRAQVGLPPKTVARLLRFADVRRRVEARPARWADVAQAAGYCDQSHLNREFRELAGITPGEFVARQIPGGGIAGEAVPFVQDGTAAAA